MSTTYPWRSPEAPAITQPTLATLTDGRSLTMRGAVDTDLTELMAMHARCSPATLSARYLSNGRAPNRKLVRSLLTTDIALVAESPTGSLAAFGNLATAEEDPTVAEVAVIVEDRWKELGLGPAMLRHLVGAARVSGYLDVVAIAPATGGWVQGALASLGEPLLQRTPFGEAVVRLALAPHHTGLLGVPAHATPRTTISRPGVA
jgi:hypothetical protein